MFSGFPARPRPRRISTIVLGAVTFLLMVGAVGCGGSDDDAAPADAGAAGADIGIGEEFSDGSFGFAVDDVRRARRIGPIVPEPGAALVRVEIDTINLSDQPAVGPFCAPAYYGVVLVDDQSRNYPADLNSPLIPGNVDHSCGGSVAPGLQRRAVLAFQVPEQAVSSIVGVAVWDPTEPGDETGDGSYQYVSVTP